MNRKLIAIDLDGTTLADDRTISKKTINVITQLRQKGHIIIIATGRPFRTSKHYYKQLKLDTPMVNFNGALCHYPSQADWKNAYHKTLPVDVVNELFRLRTNDKVNLVSAEVGKEVYTSSRYIPYPDFFPEGLDKAISIDERPIENEATCVNVFTKNKYLQNKIEKELINKHGSFVEVRTWGGFAPCIEIVTSGVQKAMGIEEVAHYYNIDQKDILAFGDEDNDYEMIQYAGHGVAMKNAITPLKDIADDISHYSNDEDGLARYLEYYFRL